MVHVLETGRITDRPSGLDNRDRISALEMSEHDYLTVSRADYGLIFARINFHESQQNWEIHTKLKASLQRSWPQQSVLNGHLPSSHGYS